MKTKAIAFMLIITLIQCGANTRTVKGEINVTKSFKLFLDGPYTREDNQGAVLLYREGKSPTLLRVEEISYTKEHNRSELKKTVESEIPENAEVVREEHDGLEYIGYASVIQQREGVTNGFDGFVFGGKGMIVLSFGFDDKGFTDKAIGIWRSIREK